MGCLTVSVDRECRASQKISKVQESSKIRSPNDKAIDFEMVEYALLSWCR